MRLVLAILVGACIGVGCSEKEPAPVSKKSGLKLAPRPEEKSAPNSPEALARAFQKTLATNNAEAMMMLSLLGHGTNAWIEFSGATLQEHRRVITGELSRLEQKPRAQRNDSEQARFFSLNLQLENLEKNHAATFNALHGKLPVDRKRFKEVQYHALQQGLQHARMIQDTMKLVRIDSSHITTNFLGGTIVFNCANLRNIGWVIVDPPRVNPNEDFGPQPPPKKVESEPFPAPDKER